VSNSVAAALPQSFAHCKDISRRQAANFYYGMRLTPEPKRSAMYAIYAWMRQADDLADEPGTLAEKAQRIAVFRKQTQQVFAGQSLPQGPLWPAVADSIERYRLPLRYFLDMLDGQMLDQEKTRYATFAELYDYCYRVASTVGLICIEIWGYQGPQARQWAEWRGIAFQLTNILRDLREDAQRGRVYLPAAMLGQSVLEPAQLLGPPSPELVRGVQYLARRAAVYYRKSEPLERSLHRDGVACSRAMCGIYHGLLQKIIARPQRVFSPRRVRLGTPTKLYIALRAPWQK